MTRYAPQWLQSGSYAASLDRRLLGALWPSPASRGCAVTPAGTGMDLHIDAGQVAVPSANNSGSVLCTSDAIETLTLNPAPPSGTDRVDLIVCRPRSADLDGTSTQEDFIFDIVKGAEGAPPGVIPAAPAGTVALARVHVAGGAASIAAADVTDLRPFYLGVKDAAAGRGLVRCQVNKTGDQNLVVNQWITVTWNNPPVGIVGGGTWDAVNHAYLPPLRGWYKIWGYLSYTTNGWTGGTTGHYLGVKWAGGLSLQESQADVASGSTGLNHAFPFYFERGLDPKDGQYGGVQVVAQSTASGVIRAGFATLAVELLSTDFANPDGTP